MENNLIFCFVEGIPVSKEECDVFFNKLFPIKPHIHQKRKTISLHNNYPKNKLHVIK